MSDRGNKNAFSFRVQRRAGAHGLQRAITDQSAPRPHTTGMSTSGTIGILGYGGAGSSGAAAETADVGDPTTGAMYFRYGYSRFGGPDITGP